MAIPLNELPEDVLVSIFAGLSLRDLATVALTCSQFRLILATNSYPWFVQFTEMIRLANPAREVLVERLSLSPAKWRCACEIVVSCRSFVSACAQGGGCDQQLQTAACVLDKHQGALGCGISRVIAVEAGIIPALIVLCKEEEMRRQRSAALSPTETGARAVLAFLQGDGQEQDQALDVVSNTREVLLRCGQEALLVDSPGVVPKGCSNRALPWDDCMMMILEKGLDEVVALFGSGSNAEDWRGIMINPGARGAEREELSIRVMRRNGIFLGVGADSCGAYTLMGLWFESSGYHVLGKHYGRLQFRWRTPTWTIHGHGDAVGIMGTWMPRRPDALHWIWKA